MFPHNETHHLHHRYRHIRPYRHAVRGRVLRSLGALVAEFYGIHIACTRFIARDNRANPRDAGGLRTKENRTTINRRSPCVRGISIVIAESEVAVRPVPWTTFASPSSHPFRSPYGQQPLSRRHRKTQAAVRGPIDLCWPILTRFAARPNLPFERGKLDDRAVRGCLSPARLPAGVSRFSSFPPSIDTFRHLEVAGDV